MRLCVCVELIGAQRVESREHLAHKNMHWNQEKYDQIARIFHINVDLEKNKNENGHRETESEREQERTGEKEKEKECKCAQAYEAMTTKKKTSSKPSD